MFDRMEEYIECGAVKATIFQRPRKQAELAVMNMYQLLTGNSNVTKEILITPQIIIRSNYNYYKTE